MEAYLLPISIGFFFGLFSGLTAILVSLRAAARVAKLEATLDGLEWDQVASLTLDIEKLKKHAQGVFGPALCMLFKLFYV